MSIVPGGIAFFSIDHHPRNELAQQTRTMYRANFEGEAGERRIAPKRKWWKLWLAT